MSSLNSITIIGNVGSDPEMRFTPNSKPVANFSVAVNEKVGETEHVEWFKIVTWGKLAETCNQYVNKGMHVCVQGRIQTQTWDTDGQKHYKTELVASKVLFLGGKKKEQGEEPDLELPF